MARAIDTLALKQQLQIAAATKTPYTLARIFRGWAKTEYDVAKVAELRREVYQAFVDTQGREYAQEFLQEVDREGRR